MFEIERLDHVALTVRDMDASMAWYRRVLGMRERQDVTWEGDPRMMVAGAACLALFSTNADAPSDLPDHGVAAIQHIAFTVNRANFEGARACLTRQNVAFREVDHGLSHSLYFSDPDGHQLEITTEEV